MHFARSKPFISRLKATISELTSVGVLSDSKGSVEKRLIEDLVLLGCRIYKRKNGLAPNELAFFSDVYDCFQDKDHCFDNLANHNVEFSSWGAASAEGLQGRFTFYAEIDVVKGTNLEKRWRQELIAFGRALLEADGPVTEEEEQILSAVSAFDLDNADLVAKEHAQRHVMADSLENASNQKLEDPAAVETCLRERNVESLKTSGAAVVVPLLQLCQSKDTTIGRRARLVLGQLTDAGAQEALFDAAATTGNLLAVEIIIAAQYVPLRAERLAMVYCLAQQWDLLSTLPAHTLIEKGLNTVSPVVRQMVIANVMAGLDGGPALLSRLLPRTTGDVLTVIKTAIGNIANQSTIDCLCTQWVELREPTLGQLIREQGWIAAAPTRVRILSALNSGRIDQVIDIESGDVPTLVEILRDQDSDLRKSASIAIQKLTKTSSIDELCRIAIRDRDPQVISLVMTAGMAPAEQQERALFYLLLGDLQSYEKIDFDQSILRAIYVAQSEDVQRQILDQLKRAGRSDWLRNAVGGKEQRKISELTPEEWEAITKVLTEDEAWEELWRLAQAAPPPMAARLLRSLRIVGWEPDIAAYRGIFQELSQISLKCTDANLPAGFSHKAVLTVGEAEDCVAFPRYGRAILTGRTNTGKCRAFWLDEDEPTSPLPILKNAFVPAGTHQGVSTIASNLTGSVVVTGGETMAAGFWRTDKPVVFQQLRGPVESVDVNEAGTMAATVSWSIVQLWAVSEIKQIKSFDQAGIRIVGVRFTPDSDKLLICSLLDGLIVTELSKSKVDRVAGSWSDPSCMAVSAGLVAIGDRHGPVHLVDYHELKELQPIALPGKPATCCEFMANGRLLICGSSDGNISLHDMQTRTCVSSWLAHPGGVASIAYNATAHLLASCGNHTQIKLWHALYEDIQSKPAAAISDADVEKLELAAAANAGGRPWLELIRGLRRCRTIFEVDLEERSNIVCAGKFDIDIEEAPQKTA